MVGVLPRALLFKRQLLKFFKTLVALHTSCQSIILEKRLRVFIQSYVQGNVTVTVDGRERSAFPQKEADTKHRHDERNKSVGQKRQNKENFQCQHWSPL